MIQVEQLSYSFPQKDLYHDVSFSILPGQHCVLCGSNGTGKSTLLDILVHTEDYILHRGKVVKDPACVIGYIPQYFVHDRAAGETVFDLLASGYRQMQAELDALCAEMAGEAADPSVFDRYQAALEKFEAADGYNYESTISRQLALAGLQHTAGFPLSQISGGEYKLVQILRAMLLSPELLVLDEPDAFLDFENIAGLSRLINGFRGAVLAVTHNRFLLASCFDKVLHLEGEGLREYDGSYAEYQLFLMRMKAEKQTAARKDAEWIEIQEQLVEKLRDDATKVIDPYRGNLLRARVSYLERLHKWKTEEPFLEVREVSMAFPAVSEEAEDGREYALKAEDFRLAFSDAPLLKHVSFTLAPHEKLALVGKNGTGKTSLLRAIVHGASPAVSVAPETKIGFLSQNYEETLHMDRSILDELEDLGLPDRSSVEQCLRPYCFEADALEQTIASLSGGEKNLLQLAKLSLSGADLLILDEPSSHLDLPSQLALEKAIREYRGAVLMVSHDFYTIVNCADAVLYADGGTIRRMSMRAFRKMFYRQYFKADYLLLEQQKTELELQIAARLRRNDSSGALALCDALEEILAKMK